MLLQALVERGNITLRKKGSQVDEQKELVDRLDAHLADTKARHERELKPILENLDKARITYAMARFKVVPGETVYDTKTGMMGQVLKYTFKSLLGAYHPQVNWQIKSGSLSKNAKTIIDPGDIRK